MKHLFKAAVVALAMCLPAATMAKITHLLPKPQQIEAKSGSAFALGRTVTITDPTNSTALQKFFTDNGCTVAGTELELLPPETRQMFENADVILSKGQANVETLMGCGKNIYYLFLIKCIRFEQLFGKAKFTPMLVAEKPEGGEGATI